MVQDGELREQAFEHVFTPVRPWNVLTSPRGYTIFTEGKGRHVTDINGKRYLDCWGTIQGANLLGYGRQEIAEAAYEQMLKLPFTPTHDGSIPKIQLAKKLADITPGSLSRVLFASDGTESIESALKVARKYHRISGFPDKYKVIGTYTYHGSTLGAMATGYGAPFRWEDFEPLPPGYLHVIHPWCSRCAFDLTYPSCHIACARQVEQVIQDENPETVSAFIDTPIASYVFVPPPEYWPMVRSICDKYGVLLIFDCIVVGLGRTGKMFAAEHFDVVPDIMVLGKGLAGGYLPISVAIVTKEVAQKFEGGPGEALIHSYTFEGLPGACAAALKTLEIIEKERLVKRSEDTGQYLFEQLQSLFKHNIVGEVRGGLGLHACVELYKDKKTMVRFNPKENVQIRRLLKEKLMARGLWGNFSNPLPVCPSLTITKDEIDEVVDVFDKVIGEIEGQIGK
jgi:adenosylmethionine-8-amino-7-oxononanoate aminotransferase